MRITTLPGTDLAVSDVCLGTMTWGEQNTEREAHEQLDYAFGQGVNFVDTAEMYPIPPRAETQGRTETYLGTWLAKQPRANVVLASKVAGPGRRDWIRNGRTDLARANIVEACDTSLARLRTDYLDLYQIHWPQRNVPMFGASAFDPSREKPGPGIAEQVEAMGALVKAGKIRHWGLSNETAWGIAAFCATARALGVPAPVTVQNSCSLVARSAEREVAEALYREGMSLLAFSPLAGGYLTGKYLQGAKPNGRYVLFDTAGMMFRKPMVPEAVAAFDAVARRLGMPLVDLAFGYVRSRWYVGATIIGATTMDQLREDLRAAQVTLDQAALDEIAQVHVRFPNPAP
ncbi:MAG TPA: aldo/keto reductase [Casimicrobiaceae bacterium]|nr:aldo/keto reductase [Casimicrobiaceae bacterium]